MKNGINQLRKRTRGGAGGIAGPVLVGVAAVSAVVVLVRSLPDFIRYLRLRRM